MRLPFYRHLNTATTEALIGYGSNMAVPFEQRWAEVDKDVHAAIPDELKHTEVPATVRVEDGDLVLYIGGQRITVLDPHPRGFFRRLHDIAVRSGGEAHTYAYVSRSSVAVDTPDAQWATDEEGLNESDAG